MASWVSEVRWSNGDLTAVEGCYDPTAVRIVAHVAEVTLYEAAERKPKLPVRCQLVLVTIVPVEGSLTYPPDSLNLECSRATPCGDTVAGEVILRRVQPEECLEKTLCNWIRQRWYVRSNPEAALL